MSYWLRLRLQWWWNCRQVHWHEIGLFWRDSCIQIHSSSVHFCINDSINCVWCCCGALQVYCTLRLYCLYNRYVTTLFIFFKGKNPPLTIQGNVVPSLFFKSLLLFKSYQRNAIFTKPKNINLKLTHRKKIKHSRTNPLKMYHLITIIYHMEKQNAVWIKNWFFYLWKSIIIALR